MFPRNGAAERAQKAVKSSQNTLASLQFCRTDLGNGYYRCSVDCTQTGWWQEQYQQWLQGWQVDWCGRRVRRRESAGGAWRCWHVSSCDILSLMSFIHLHTHTAYSLLEGALRIERLGDFCRRNNTPALAMTDRGNLFGALEFSEALADKGIQPIIGVCLPVHPSASTKGLQTGLPHRLPHILLLAKNQGGYRNLMKLISGIHLHNGIGDIAPDIPQTEADAAPSPHEPHATLDALADCAEGLLCLTGGSDGLLEHCLLHGQEQRARDMLQRLKEMFPGRLYVELQRHGLEKERQYEAGQIALAYALDLPLVATNDARFHERADFPAYDVLCCIEQGVPLENDARRRATEEHFLKSPQEMRRIFADLPEAIDNSVEVARRCCWRPLPREAILPRFPDAGDSEGEELRNRARSGLQKRLHSISLAAPQEEYEQRLEGELDVIVNMNYAGYFLVVADFIQWARGQEIPVGPGRGSGAGSLVAYALTITDIDPLRFGLLFERFLNAARISMPDFDIDFCPDRRDQVIRYVCDKYGRDRVAQIITFGTLQARAVLRDVGRVLGVPYRDVDRLCKLVPYTPANPMSLETAIKEIPDLAKERESDERIARMMGIAVQLEGLYRHASTHAAGIVISDRPLDELVPLYRDPRSEMPVTQFNMKWAESAGLVKFDFLGLKTLSIIDLAIRQSGAPRDMPFDDAETFAMLRRGETMGVFQVEGAGMRDTLRRMGADRIEDLIALIALYRPGPMDNIPKYIDCKHGRERPNYLHDMLRPVLEETYGVIVYQEQVMQIARILAGFSLNEADLLRRAMGKKIRSEMERQKQRFVSGVLANNISRPDAENIFELVSKFAGYGFNKSHAAAYALLVYQTAYLKAHYPAPFLAACMSWDMNNADRLRALREESERLQVSLLPPCVNRSGEEFQVDGEGAILYALSAVRHIGRRAARHIVEEREKGGAFRDLFDFARRLSPRQVPRRALEFLAKAGAFDALEANRNRVLQGVERLSGISTRVSAEQEDAQDSLFGGDDNDALLTDAPLADAPMWSDMERLRHEFEAVGFHLSGHPLDPHREVLERAGVLSLRQAMAEKLHSAHLAGVITGFKVRKAASGGRYAFLSLSDISEEFEAVVFAETLSQSRQLLEVGALLVAQVELQQEGENRDMRLRITSLHALEDFLANRPVAPRAPAFRVPGPPPRVAAAALPVIEIRVRTTEALPFLRASLDAARQSNGREDGVEVVLILQGAGGAQRDARMRLPGRFFLSGNMYESLAGIAGVAVSRPNA